MSFRKLAITSAVATFLLVALGGLVRATKSGLGCGDDWPVCNGRLVPALEAYTTAIEYSHRMGAAVVSLLLGSLALWGVLRRRRSPRLARASVAAFGLVLLQAVIGAIVVKLHLEAEAVVLHLGAALALGGLLIHVAAEASAEEGALEPEPDAALARRAWFAAGSVLLLLLVGSYVRGIHAGDAFPDWPLMSGRIVPPLGSEVAAAHFAHRALALVVGVVVAVVVAGVVRRKREHPVAARWAHAAAGLFVVEVLLGAANVWTRVDSAPVRAAHLVTGALIWACLVRVAAVCRPALRAAAPRPAPARVALEGGR